jgi:hypothetical protein
MWKRTRGLKVVSVNLWGRLISGQHRSCRLLPRSLPGGSHGGYGGACGVSSQLSRDCGPLNRVLLLLIGRECVSLDCDVSWTHGILCGNTPPYGMMWVPPGPHDILCISLSSELQSRQIIYPFRSSRRARCNGADQFGI